MKLTSRILSSFCFFMTCIISYGQMPIFSLSKSDTINVYSVYDESCLELGFGLGKYSSVTIDPYILTEKCSWQDFFTVMLSYSNSDSSISSQNYVHYFHAQQYGIYKNMPCIGVSWVDAMEFCRRKTLIENPGDTIRFVYRLPKFSEISYWIVNDKNVAFGSYSGEWLLNSKTGTGLLISNEDYIRIPTAKGIYSSDPWNRRLVIGGDSCLLTFTKLNFYQDKAYPNVSFRVVKQKVDSYITREMLKNQDWVSYYLLVFGYLPEEHYLFDQ